MNATNNKKNPYVGVFLINQIIVYNIAICDKLNISNDKTYREQLSKKSSIVISLPSTYVCTGVSMNFSISLII